MNKTGIIIQREYFNIVKRPSFLISTFLVPLAFAAIFGIQILAAKFVEKEEVTVLLMDDESRVVTDRLVSDGVLTFEKVSQSLEQLRARIDTNKTEILLSYPPSILNNKQEGQVILYSQKNLSPNVLENLEDKLRKATRDYKNEIAGISDVQLEQAKFSLDITNKLTKGDESNNVLMATIVGVGICFLMYMLMAIYGSVLMQSIIEEKSNRIVEVIVSSVKPFQLLMGKTLAIASVGITQFLLWGILTTLVMLVLSPFMAGVDPNAMAQPGAPQVEVSEVEEIVNSLMNFDWSVLWFFPLYFLGGFFLYGSLYAAAGSAVDNVQDAQQFVIPVTIPLILPMLFVTNIIQNPNGVFATVASMIPFFSPMSMMVRLSMTDVPWYEVALSLGILVASFLGCVWIAARVYRTGILMYGKKPTFKEMFKWITYRQ